MSPLPPPPPVLLERASLFLDFDGTLADFVAPDAAPEFGDDLRDVLRRLSQRLDGRLAIISGRALDSLIDVVGLDAVELSGSHGIERLSAAGHRSVHAPITDLGSLHQAAREFAADHGLFHEEKPTGIALHYRGRPDAGAEVERYAGRLAHDNELELRVGHMVAEVRVRGPHKGDAVRLLMAEEPFHHGIPVFVGDDMTDEDGFEAARDLGGEGVLVGPLRATKATHALPSVAAVRHWLANA